MLDLESLVSNYSLSYGKTYDVFIYQKFKLIKRDSSIVKSILGLNYKENNDIKYKTLQIMDRYYRRILK